MFAVERREKIQEMIQQQGRVAVADLSEFFGVSDDTIRLDLKHLEEHRLLVRTHGGALPVKKVSHSTPYEQRLNLEAEEKIAIARKAVQLVQPGDTIILEGSTTTRPMADFLPENVGLTVVTNSPGIANAAIVREGIEVILLGGRLNKDAQVAVGPIVIEQISRMRVDQAFFSTSGFLYNRGATSASIEDAFMKKAFVAAAKQRVLLVTEAKFGQEGLMLSLPLSDIDTVVCGPGATGSEMNWLIENGIKVLRAE